MGYTDVHILNVGAGSCAVVEHASGNLSMVDINDGGTLRSYEKDALAKRGSAGLARIKAQEEGLTDPIDWFRARFGNRSLFRFVLSHPDADHMSGIRRILTGGELDAANFWDIPHKRTRTRGQSKTDAAWQDWLAYYRFRNNKAVEGVTWPKRLNPLRGHSRDFWNTDQIDILSPTTPLIDKCDKADDYNDASYVLRVRHAKRAVLLPGDAEDPAWNDMVADETVHLRAHILVAAHHGRRNGYNEEALKVIKPNAVIVSSDELDPDHDAEPLYREYTKYVYSTRKHGDIRVRMEDDGSFAVYDGGSRRLQGWS